jgi:hypothetical protein
LRHGLAILLLSRGLSWVVQMWMPQTSECCCCLWLPFSFFEHCCFWLCVSCDCWRFFSWGYSFLMCRVDVFASERECLFAFEWSEVIVG